MSKRPTISPPFNATTLPAYTRAGRNPSTISALAAIEGRAERVNRRAVEHYKKFEDRWVAKEAIRLWQRRLEAQGRHPLPPDEVRKVSAEEIAKVASRNVIARTNARLSKINAAKVRMTNALVRNLNRTTIRQAFNEAAPDGSALKRRIKP